MGAVASTRASRGDPKQLQATIERLYPVRDRVLENAHVGDGDVVLDAGMGTGLIAFGALGRVGEHGKVIFLDASQKLLDHCRALTKAMGVLHRSRFVRASADDLSGIADSSVDIVTTRSVVMDVPAKEQVFREFHRVLKPGGRVSMYERINSFGNPELPHLLWGRDVTSVQDLALKVRALIEPPEHRVLLEFDKRDLMRHAEAAGFGEVRIELRANVASQSPTRWDTLKRLAFPPPSVTLEEAIERALTPEEANRFTAHLRPLVEVGQGTTRWAATYLWAQKR